MIAVNWTNNHDWQCQMIFEKVLKKHVQGFSEITASLTPRDTKLITCALYNAVSKVNPELQGKQKPFDNLGKKNKKKQTVVDHYRHYGS